MNIQPIQMDKWAARYAAKEYLGSVRKHRAERLERATADENRARLKKTAIELEDEALHSAYSALGRGKKVINLNTVMRNAGLTKNTRLPRLAICRADAARAELSVSRETTQFLSRINGFVKYGDKNAQIPGNIFGTELTDFSWRKTSGLPSVSNVVAMAPQVPPRFRPEPEKVSELYLLWEAKWELRPPDPDPFLIKPLGGGFFVIVAQWDMTPLEQSILETRI